MASCSNCTKLCLAQNENPYLNIGTSQFDAQDYSRRFEYDLSIGCFFEPKIKSDADDDDADDDDDDGHDSHGKDGDDDGDDDDDDEVCSLDESTKERFEFGI